MKIGCQLHQDIGYVFAKSDILNNDLSTKQIWFKKIWSYSVSRSKTKRQGISENYQLSTPRFLTVPYFDAYYKNISI